MGKSTHRKGHQKKVAAYRKELLENRRLEKKRRQELFSQLQEQYIKEQQEKEQEATPVDQDLIDEIGDFKLDD